MAEEPDTEQLRAEQLARELETPLEEETVQHERRADKAHYLREKLEERAHSEREAAEADSSQAEDA
jgi:hypothetical protein